MHSNELRCTRVISLTPCDSVWLCMSLRDSALFRMTFCDFVWLCMTPHDSAWLCVTPGDSMWLHVTPCDSTWLCMNPRGVRLHWGVGPRGVRLVVYVSPSQYLVLPYRYKWIWILRRGRSYRRSWGERRGGTESEDWPEGLHQISDQSVHKWLRKMFSRQYVDRWMDGQSLL
jgi:hypothetical protein